MFEFNTDYFKSLKISFNNYSIFCVKHIKYTIISFNDYCIFCVKHKIYNNH